MSNFFQSLSAFFQPGDRSNKQALGTTANGMTGLLRDAPRYIVERAGQRSHSLATPEDVADFLNACGIQPESQRWDAAMAGVPIDVDDSTVRFIEVGQPDVSTVPPAWVVHAYPLQQVRIELQGTRHSDRLAIIEQLETVLARLRAGEHEGSEHDDDFGYRFSVTSAATASVFGSEPAGHL